MFDRLSYRSVLLAVVAAGLFSTAASFYMQYVMLLNPCPLCILQRVAVMAVTLAAALALLLPHRRCGARAAEAGLVSLPALWGLGVAVYQIWLQSLPAEERPTCGAPWTFRLRDWPLFKLWEPVVRGLGDCGVREYVMGLPLPVWSLLFFGAALAAVWGGWWKMRSC